jgi:disulfide oxidoreductase YuzD
MQIFSIFESSISNQIFMITLEQRKYNFIEKYIKLKNLKTLEKLEKIIDDNIIYEEVILNDEMTNAINEGISSLETGKGIFHDEVISEMRKKYPTLKF